MTRYRVRLAGRRRLSADTFELCFERPPGFPFQAGQKIRFFHQALERDYTLISGPHQDELAICVRHIAQGRFSPSLLQAPVGKDFQISAAFGYFTYQPSPRPAVCVATGTGIAPFVAFARAGIRNFHLLHGVRTTTELYFEAEMRQAAGVYVPCISTPPGAAAGVPGIFNGRVTLYLERHLPVRAYDFYLCGRGAMIEDATRIIDRRFPGALVFAERFF